ncbi:putative pterin-4-alpha-carbinolamine dehydratase [Crocosphaera subtropica ATCC 51142]|uniref:Putative pterin-4-alpha-carbinolamine dehydratase n=2 Tax=Crocosphaera TaxID=263510 RepID=B1WPK6_CROS5|nr:putative pterin-4-alpha-carbinolamine dehydratase [Crocosphaera subtropica ATCC 51142]
MLGSINVTNIKLVIKKMVEQLTQRQCTACTGDSSPVSEEDIKQLKPQIPDWKIEDENGQLRLVRTYEFSNFKKALAFTQKIGDKAEEEGHHPSLLTEWGKVTVIWWTHAINGLHENDFIMAAKTDQIAGD